MCLFLLNFIFFRPAILYSRYDDGCIMAIESQLVKTVKYSVTFALRSFYDSTAERHTLQTLCLET